jgi:predicted lipid-binding transport protein (Tim44 family)
MPNYIVTRLSCWSVSWYFFLTGTCLGGMGGFVLGLMERQAISILGGLFLGLLIGLFFGLTGLIFASLFNIVAPVTGGIAIRLEQFPETTPAALTPPDSAQGTPAQQSLFPRE